MQQIFIGLLQGFFVAFVTSVIGILVRREWLAALLSAIVFGIMLSSFGTYKGPWYSAAAFFMGGCLSFVATRCGVLAAVAGMFVLHVQIMFEITSEPTAWYGQGFLLDLLLVLGMSVWAAKSALGGQKVLGAGVWGE